MVSKSAVTPARPQEVTVSCALEKGHANSLLTMGIVTLTFIKHLVLFITEGVFLSCKTTL